MSSNKLQLPPKRWESADDAKYDQIRFRRWFTRGQKRKHLIPALKLAALFYSQGQALIKTICLEFNVDEREFRDFYRFHYQKAAFEPLGPKEQVVLNAAYAIYCDSNAEYSFSTCVEKAADYYGMKKRPMRELWEVNPNAYPTVYQKPTQ